jgi:hypothetical protein
MCQALLREGGVKALFGEVVSQCMHGVGVYFFIVIKMCFHLQQTDGLTFSYGFPHGKVQ